jgi:ABC-type branched-subunit amino acid transport system substrate-binding protein
VATVVRALQKLASRRRVPNVFASVVFLTAAALLVGLIVPFARDPKVRITTRTISGTQSEVGGGAGGGSTTDEVAGGTGTGSAAGRTRSGGGADISGSDVGVTDSTIKLGIAIIDVGAAKSFGFNFDLGNQRARWDALLASINSKGGINGRKLTADYRTIDAADVTNSAQQACVAWTKDAKVFAILAHSQFPQTAVVCAIGQGNTPVFTTDGIDESYYRNGLFVSMQASDNRIVVDHARYLHEAGLLKGKTIGILTGEGSERLSIDKSLIPELAALGYKVADVEEVPGGTAGTQKMTIAVSNFKAAGVDFVIVEANVILAGPFAQAADRAGYRPQYGLSDFNNQVNDQVASYYPDSFEGTIALSTHRFPEYRAGLPPPPADKACMDISGKADPTIYPAENSAHEVGLGECAIFNALVGAATAAGPRLNRATLVRGLDTLGGPFGIGATLDGSFGPGKHDAVDYERRVVWRKSCRCWQLADAPTAIRRMSS